MDSYLFLPVNGVDRPILRAVGKVTGMDHEVVRRVARIARMELTQEEVEEFSKDLEEILDYLSVLDQAPPCHEAGFNPVPVEDVLREDWPSLDIDPAELRRLLGTYQDWVRGPRLA